MNKIGLMVVGVLLLAAPSLRAASPEDIELDNRGIRYACTGVAESKEDPRWAAYPAKLMFTTGGTAYVTYVQVKITDETGKTVLEVDCDTPWLVAKLKPGTYQVQVTAERKFTRKTAFKVTGGPQSSLAIRFPEIQG